MNNLIKKQTEQQTEEYSGPQEKSPHRRFWILLAGLAIATLTASLSHWQWQRAQYKKALAAQYAALKNASPMRLETALEPALPEGTPLIAKGRWLSQHTIYLDNRPQPNDGTQAVSGQVGYYVLTPLQTGVDQQKQAVGVLVLRGWLPRMSDERKQLPNVATPEYQVEVQGQATELTSNFISLNAKAQIPEGQLWQNLDLTAYRAQIAARSGIQLQPFVLRQQSAHDAQDSLRRTWAPPSFGIEKHYGYAAQWAGICLASLIFTGLLWRRAK